MQDVARATQHNDVVTCVVPVRSTCLCQCYGRRRGTLRLPWLLAYLMGGWTTHLDEKLLEVIEVGGGGNTMVL